jgi:flagellar basal-body rod modification protein FlgD
MTDVSSVSSATTGTSGTSNTYGSSELGEEQFLQLLVAQMQYQDPLEPMSNSEFVAQLAQFSNVEQLVGVNEGINYLYLSQQSMGNVQASSLIGKEVEVKSDELTVESTDTSKSAAFTLSDDAETVTVKFRNAEGDVVRAIDLGQQSAGEVQCEWDLLDGNGNKVSPGTYTVEVTATDIDGTAVTAETQVSGTVTGVSYESGVAELEIGDINAYLADIISVSESGTSGEGTEE